MTLRHAKGRSLARSGGNYQLWQSSWAILVMVIFCCVTGCGSVGRNIGVGLAGTGVVASTTTGILAFGCTNPDLNNPQVERRGPCLPPQTYEEAKPVIWTTFVLGIILTATGLAVIATVDEKSKKSDPVPRPRPHEPIEQESCKDSKYCY